MYAALRLVKLAALPSKRIIYMQETLLYWRFVISLSMGYSGCARTKNTRSAEAPPRINCHEIFFH